MIASSEPGQLVPSMLPISVEMIYFLWVLRLMPDGNHF